jgi:hypothetical protein
MDQIWRAETEENKEIILESLGVARLFVLLYVLLRPDLRVLERLGVI